MPATRRQTTQSKPDESDGKKPLNSMSQDDIDPSMVPLPSSDDTIYVGDDEHTQECDLHENAFASASEGDYQSDEEFEENAIDEIMHPTDPSTPVPADDGDCEMSSDREEEEQSESDARYEQALRYHRDSLRRGGKVKNHRESGVSAYSIHRRQESHSPIGSQFSPSQGSQYNPEEDQEHMTAEEQEEDEHEDLNKTVKFEKFAPSLLSRESFSHMSTPSRRRQPEEEMTPKPFGFILATPAIQATPTTYFGNLFPTTPFLSHTTPTGHHSMTVKQQAALENQVLMSQLKDREAHIKYLEGLIETSADAGEVLEEFVSFSPEKKRQNIMTTPRPAVIEEGEQLTVKKRRTRGPMTPATTTKLFSASSQQSSNRKTSVKSRSPSKLFTTSTFDSASIIGSPSIRPSFATSLPPLPAIKSAKERKEEKRRRMTKEFREFSEIPLDKLKSWMPPVAVEAVEEVEEEENKENVTPQDVDGDRIMEDAQQESKTELPKTQSPLKQSPAETLSGIAEWEAKPLDMTNFAVPEPIPERPLFNYSGAPLRPSGRKRAKSAPPVPHAPPLTPEEEEAADAADYTVSPLAQEMITALQNRILALEHELDTTNGALQKAMAHLVGEQRARKQAEEVKEFLEMEKEFGVCCKYAQDYNQRKALRKEQTNASPAPAQAQAQALTESTTTTTTTTTAPTSTKPAATAAQQHPPVHTTNARKRTRDESEGINGAAPKGIPTRAGSRLGQYPPEKKILSASAGNAISSQQPPTRQTRSGQNASVADKSSIPKKSAKTNTTSTYEKPAVRAPARPRSRLGNHETDSRYGNKAPERPNSRLGNRGRVDRYGGNLVNTTETRSGSTAGERKDLDVFGRLAAGARSRR